MASIREKLIAKIKAECDLCGLENEITKELKIFRPTMSWQHITAGRMIWYWYINGICIGSAEKMKELLTAKRIEVYRPASGVDYELSSS